MAGDTFMPPQIAAVLEQMVVTEQRIAQLERELAVIDADIAWGGEVGEPPADRPMVPHPSRRFRSRPRR